LEDFLMRWFRFGILVLAALILQVSVCQPLGLGPQQIMPDLFVLLAVVLAFWPNGDYDVLAACWVLGLTKDLSSTAPLGCYALSFGILALLVRRLRDVFYGEKLLPLMGITVMGSILVEQSAFFLLVWKGEQFSDRYGYLLLGMIFSAFFTGALTPYAYWLLRLLQRQLGLPGSRIYMSRGGNEWMSR
jgi:rod shape-determining protein MreD